MSSRLLAVVSRSVKSTPASARRRSSVGTPVSSAEASKRRSSRCPPSSMRDRPAGERGGQRGQRVAAGRASGAACRACASAPPCPRPAGCGPCRSRRRGRPSPRPPRCNAWSGSTVTPSSRSRRTSAHMSRRRLTSTPAVGSSRNSTSGSWLSALAIITRRFMPPDSSTMRASRFSHSDRSRSRRSTKAGSGGRPNRRRLKRHASAGRSRRCRARSPAARGRSRDRAARKSRTTSKPATRDRARGHRHGAADRRRSASSCRRRWGRAARRSRPCRSSRSTASSAR